MLWILATTLGLAQNQPLAPDINSQLYKPTMDSRMTLWTEDSGEIDDAHGDARVMLSYVNDPLVFIPQGSQDSVAIVSDALQANVLGMYHIDRFRLGIDIPVYLLTTSEVADNGAGLGDLALDGRVTFLDHDDAAVGAALSGRLILPTATVATSLGAAGLGGEISAHVDRKADKLLLAANIGTRVNAPSTEVLQNVDLGDQLIFRLGGGYSVTPDAGVSLDLVGQVNYSEPLNNPAGAPLEALAGGWLRATPDWVFRAGLGRGITPGIGSPTARVLLGIAYERDRASDRDGDGFVDREDTCPEEPEDVDGFQDEDGCPDVDNDEDGIVDANDGCPMDAEDPDGFDDSDGCPDISTAVAVRVINERGEAINDATFEVSGRATRVKDTTGAMLNLHDGDYILAARAPKYLSSEIGFTAPVQSRTVTITLEDAVVTGTLRVEIMDPNGVHVSAADWAVDDTQGPELVNGVAEQTISIGDHVLTAEAEGYAPARMNIRVSEDTLTHSVILLQPSLVVVQREQIEIKDRVYFETGKAAIKTQSHALLDEIANILINHQELTKIRIEGHTDSRGSAAGNLRLSQARAESVKTYLIDKGVESNRLVSEGFGEDKPLDPREVAEAWEQNRRVDFFISERSD
jgi:outer membrane protein OmpA-like peptidoglycan-associated protein